MAVARWWLQYNWATYSSANRKPSVKIFSTSRPWPVHKATTSCESILISPPESINSNSTIYIKEPKTKSRWSMKTSSPRILCSFLKGRKGSLKKISRRKMKRSTSNILRSSSSSFTRLKLMSFLKSVSSSSWKTPKLDTTTSMIFKFTKRHRLQDCGESSKRKKLNHPQRPQSSVDPPPVQKNSRLARWPPNPKTSKPSTLSSRSF